MLRLSTSPKKNQEQTGLTATNAAVSSARYRHRQRKGHTSSGFSDVHDEHLLRAATGTQSYVIYTDDGRDGRGREMRSGKNVIVCNEFLFRRAMKNPNFCVDGTFNMVTRTKTMGGLS